MPMMNNERTPGQAAMAKRLYAKHHSFVKPVSGLHPKRLRTLSQRQNHAQPERKHKVMVRFIRSSFDTP